MEKALYWRYAILIGLYIAGRLVGLSDGGVAPILFGISIAMAHSVATDYAKSIEHRFMLLFASQGVYARALEERIEKLEALIATESEA